MGVKDHAVRTGITDTPPLRVHMVDGHGLDCGDQGSPEGWDVNQSPSDGTGGRRGTQRVLLKVESHPAWWKMPVIPAT